VRELRFLTIALLGFSDVLRDPVHQISEDEDAEEQEETEAEKDLKTPRRLFAR
jgi:hypothetical protein